jgi:hypothetical protein
MTIKTKKKTQKDISYTVQPFTLEVSPGNAPLIEDEYLKSTQAGSDSMWVGAPPINGIALSKIPTRIVAGIAAQLNCPDADAVARVLQAYKLLDAAESARNGLIKSGSYITGLNDFQWDRLCFKYNKEIEREIATAPGSFKGEKGETRFQFDPVLNFLLGGATRKIKETQRHTLINRLVTFVQEASTAPTVAGNLFGNSLEAESLELMGYKSDKARAQKLVDEWIRYGIPGVCYTTLKYLYPQWWKFKVAEQNSNNRKGKGRKPLKKTDGRRGARVSTFFEALKKTP